MAPERYAALLVAALMLYACTLVAIGEHACSGQQIIITFGPGVDVMSRGLTDDLSTDAGMPIEYMRHLFGDHHLYCVQQLSQTVTMSDALKRLQDRADIQRVEIDRLKHPGAAR
jgi:AraC-like DNA-binding protein